MVNGQNLVADEHGGRCHGVLQVGRLLGADGVLDRVRDAVERRVDVFELAPLVSQPRHVGLHGSHEALDLVVALEHDGNGERLADLKSGEETRHM